MDISRASAIVTGGASGIGAAVARWLAGLGAVAVVAEVTQTAQVAAAVEVAAAAGPLRACVNAAGVGRAQRTIGHDGTFDMTRLAATAMSRNEPDFDGARCDRQVGQRRGLRRPDRPGVVRCVEGWCGGLDPARRSGPVRGRHPAEPVAPGLVDTDLRATARARAYFSCDDWARRTSSREWSSSA